MVITTVNLWRHIRTQHTPQPPRKCDLCNKNFKNKYSLREHIRISHEQKVAIKSENWWTIFQLQHGVNWVSLHLVPLHTTDRQRRHCSAAQCERDRDRERERTLRPNKWRNRNNETMKNKKEFINSHTHETHTLCQSLAIKLNSQSPRSKSIYHMVYIVHKCACLSTLDVG